QPVRGVDLRRPDHRRAGIGTRLADWLERRAAEEGAERIGFDVHEPFGPFFERRGYRREPGCSELGGVPPSGYWSPPLGQ
ncbi:MAG TPA: GNAT family N-acetyltransferase, partial [Sandaracinaceae bacterium]